jgi:hypothetical protein
MQSQLRGYWFNIPPQTSLAASAKVTSNLHITEVGAFLTCPHSTRLTVGHSHSVPSEFSAAAPLHYPVAPFPCWHCVLHTLILFEHHMESKTSSSILFCTPFLKKFIQGCALVISTLMPLI